jgi:hypothetical protein
LVSGGIKNDSGKVTQNPIPHPLSHAEKKMSTKPTFTEAIINDIHIAINNAVIADDINRNFKLTIPTS